MANQFVFIRKQYVFCDLLEKNCFYQHFHSNYFKKVVFCFIKCSDILCFRLIIVGLYGNYMQYLRNRLLTFCNSFYHYISVCYIYVIFFLLQMSMRHNIPRQSPWLPLILAKWKIGFSQLKVPVIQSHYPCPWQLILPI